MKISKEVLQEEMAKLREHYDHEMGKVEQLAVGVRSPGQQGESSYIQLKIMLH